MATDPNDWNQRLNALQNKSGGDNINRGDLDNRLANLQQYQKKDVDPNATDNDLWNRLNHLDATNANNDMNPYQPSIQNKNKKAVQNSKLSEHQTDALLNRMADEINLEKTVQNNDLDFDIDDELDDIDDDPALFAFMKEVENDINKKDTKPPDIHNINWNKMVQNTQTNAQLTQNDQTLIQNAMKDVPQDIIKASKKHAEKEYKAYKQKEKLYQKMGQMGVDPDDYLNEIMGDSDGSDSDINDARVKALVMAAQDEVALEDKFGPVATAKTKQNDATNVKQQNKKKKDEDEEEEYWDSYADYDTPKKKKKKRKGWF
eukprot:17515_1